MTYIPFTHRLHTFCTNTQGSILPMMAVGTMIMIIAIGAAIDLSREQVLRAKLDSAIDASTLAATKSAQYSFECDPLLQQTSEQCITRHINFVGTRYFKTNFANAFGFDSSIKPTFIYDPSTGSIIGNVNASMPTTLMQVAGITSLPVSASAVALASVFYMGADINHVNPMVSADPTTGMYTQPYTYTLTDSSGNTKTINGNSITFSTGDGTTPNQEMSIDATGITVAGQIKVGISNMPCNPSFESALQYNKALHSMQYCDGNEWRTMVVQYP